MRVCWGKRETLLHQSAPTIPLFIHLENHHVSFCATILDCVATRVTVFKRENVTVFKREICNVPDPKWHQDKKKKKHCIQTNSIQIPTILFKQVWNVLLLYINISVPLSFNNGCSRWFEWLFWGSWSEKLGNPWFSQYQSDFSSRQHHKGSTSYEWYF